MAAAVLKAFDLILPQDRATQQRLALWGVGGRLVNLKYVGEPLACDEAELARLKTAIGARPVVLAASTHPGEEALIASAFDEMPAITPAPLLIVAPRHPERGGEVASLLRGRGQVVARRSAGDPTTVATGAYVADTLGEMGLWFRLADVAVMGGSFVDGIGGHNPLEPARLGAPPLTGPFAFNFTDVYGEMLAEQAALLADLPEHLTRLVHGLLSDPARAKRTGATARAFARSRSAALDDAWAELEPLLP